MTWQPWLLLSMSQLHRLQRIHPGLVLFGNDSQVFQLNQIGHIGL